MSFLYKLQRRFGKYAVKGLTKYIIIAYIAGYILEIIGTYSGSGLQYYLTLMPGQIMHGQVWRLFTWVLTPPSSLGVFTIIMLIVYYQLGTVLEKVWGDFFYNLFIFFGLLCTVIGAFLIYYLGDTKIIDLTGGTIFSTYYVSLSIFLGFAMTFPNQQMLLFFIIPIKIKYLAILDAAYLLYQIVRISYWEIRIQIICSMASVIVLALLRLSSGRKRSHRTNNTARKPEFKRVVSPGTASAAKKGCLHKCYICGQTEADNPELEFRYCSKCSGNKEYCSNHLFTHEHS